ncbi:hypothetical protein G5V59_03210 [Nocardioides sp. W3-2-3]|uniref:hypothetical protein n=1 Tax=Nocardioides convexus TaxID=2712224 RepID=UPI0024183F40|nr:hypothetical protein [Nocardioides convexus]NGZ99713.1 hypothetical protein [Nocardioides convexus]
MVAALGRALGERSAELPALLAADNEPPRVTLVARPGRAERAESAGYADAVLALRHHPRRR